MSTSTSSRSDQWTISLIIITFANVWWLTKIWYAFSLHRNQIIQHFLSASSHSRMFHHWQTSDVLFLSIEIKSLNNSPQHHHIRQCLMVYQHSMSLSSSSRSDHWTISLIIITFANLWWLTNIPCASTVHRHQIIQKFLLGWTHSAMFDDWPTLNVFSLHPDQIIEQLLRRWTHSPMFDDWQTSEVLFLFIKIRS